MHASGAALVGDVRLDDPQALADELRLPRDAPARPPDAALLLALLVRRGTQALAELRGDFAFVLVDPRARRLLAMRDAFGVKPLYVAHAGSLCLVGNVPQALLAHPRVDRALDRGSVADFLVHGHRLDRTATFQRGLRRVAPGHVLRADPRGRGTRRIAGCPEPGPAPAADARERAAELAHALEGAVRARLGAGRAALLMSGGLDSTAVAACAAGIAHVAGREPPRATTAVHLRGPADAEGRFAALAAAHLGLAWRPLALDAQTLGPAPPGVEAPVAPSLDLYRGAPDALAELARETPVVLTGFGGDPLLRTAPDHLRALLRREPLAAARQVAAHLRAFGRPPGLGLRRAWRRRAEAAEGEALPAWLAPGLADSAALRARARAHRAALRRHESVRPDHPGVEEMLHAPVWAELFEGLDAASTGLAVELRHPFFDRALVARVLATPPHPDCVDKRLLREAMHGRLPDAVRTRPKAPLAERPPPPLAPGARERFLARLRAVPELATFVDVRQLERALQAGAPPGSLIACLPALALADWLWARAHGADAGATAAPCLNASPRSPLHAA